MNLYKTTVVIWSKVNPSDLELSDLAYEADKGNAYCSKYVSEKIANPEEDPDWDDTEFFN
jgi:hypothetical protein